MRIKFLTLTAALSLWALPAFAMGGDIFSYARIEGDAGAHDGETVYSWDIHAWVGGDENKLYVTSEGEADEHEIESAEVQALWSRMIAPFWDVQVGVRHDFEPEGLTHGVLGLHGTAPYLFEVDAAAFLTENGDLHARAEVEYELIFTQRLIGSPYLELEVAAGDIPEMDVASGFTHVEAGFQLRYEVTRKFAPYVEVTYESALAGTADLRRAAGEDVDATIIRAGLRLIF